MIKSLEELTQFISLFPQTFVTPLCQESIYLQGNTPQSYSIKVKTNEEDEDESRLDEKLTEEKETSRTGNLSESCKTSKPPFSKEAEVQDERSGNKERFKSSQQLPVSQFIQMKTNKDQNSNELNARKGSHEYYKNQDSRNTLKYVITRDIFEAIAMIIDPVIGLYPPELRKTCGEIIRQKCLLYGRLQQKLPKDTKQFVLNMLEKRLWLIPENNLRIVEEAFLTWFKKYIYSDFTVVIVEDPVPRTNKTFTKCIEVLTDLRKTKYRVWINTA